MNQPNLKCTGCKIACDFLDPRCKLTAQEVAQLPRLVGRRKLYKPRPPIPWNFVPDTSMRSRYDKRRKRDTPRRQWERSYRKERREKIQAYRQQAAG